MYATTALRQEQPHVHHTLPTDRRTETIRTAIPASSPSECPNDKGTSHVGRTLSQLHHTASKDKEEGLFHVKQALSHNRTDRLVVRSRGKHVHDPIQILNARELDAHTAFSNSKGDLHIGIQPVRQG
jgi:hypothetical protein